MDVPEVGVVKWIQVAAVVTLHAHPACIVNWAKPALRGRTAPRGPRPLLQLVKPTLH